MTALIKQFLRQMAIGLTFVFTGARVLMLITFGSLVTADGLLSQKDLGLYDSWQRKSLYIPMRDGIQLAVDYYQPTRNGELHTAPLPVVWRFSPYGRYVNDNPKNKNQISQRSLGTFNGPEVFENLLRNGYIVAEADVRGYAGSYGTNQLWLGPQEGRDAHDITEWLAEQSWSNGNIGMLGLSYLASVQYFAMAEKPPHLKATFAAMGQFDHFDTFSSNGVPRADLPAYWRLIRANLDMGQGARVDADTDGVLLHQATRDHYGNRDLPDQLRGLEFRDSVDLISGDQHHLDASPWGKLGEIEESGIAIYHFTGWFDAYGKDQLLYFANLRNPQKLHVGPYFHTDSFGIDIQEETRRWFDHWLKKIDTGMMNEPPIRYFVVGEEPEFGWKSATQWPLPQEVREEYFFTQGKTGTVQSVNDGSLSVIPIFSDVGKDLYLVDRGVSLGSFLARNNGVMRECGEKFKVDKSCYLNSGYPDLSERYDAKGLTYTSGKLVKDMVIAGHPVVRLWVTANTDDADFFIVLEEVEPDGTSHFVTTNAVRASHRTVNKAPFNNLGLPWLGHFKADAKMLTRMPSIIELDLKPIANLFDKGNRIRVTITGAEAEEGDASPLSGNREFTIYRNKKYSSSIDLPVIPLTMHAEY
jgi:putative CocE/NonD family hydrolase